MSNYLFSLPTDTPASLQTRIREMLVTAILDGHIPPGTALPSGRGLATQLHVARNTVVLVYQQLVDEGFLEARERSGHYVCADILHGRAHDPHIRPRSSPTAVDWTTRLGASLSTQRNVSKPIDWQRYPYPFLYGQFDPALFPIADWRECSREAVSVAAIHDWAGDRIDRDDPLLIEQIHTRILPRRGVWADADEILVTLGAQHALYLIAELVLGTRSVVGMEDPGYPDARNIFAQKAARLIALRVDPAGIAPDAALGDCDCLYVTPSHQYPTTVTMTLARRRDLLRRADEADAIIIEDDYESETNYVGEPTPALKSLDNAGRVLYVGSLSKVLAPGLRMGFLVGPRELIREARALRRLMLRHPPANNQHIVAQFLKRGHYDSLARRLSHAFRDRWETMGNALQHHLPNSTRRPTFGGTAYWVKGTAGLDVPDLAERARQAGILIEPGDICFMDPQAQKAYFRLGFSSITVDRIDAGIGKLAELVHRRS